MRFILYSHSNTSLSRIEEDIRNLNPIRSSSASALRSLPMDKDDIVIIDYKEMVPKTVSGILSAIHSAIALYDRSIKEIPALLSYQHTVYLPYDYSEEELAAALDKAESTAEEIGTLKDILVGDSAVMERIRKTIGLIIKSKVRIFHIAGETGTGKNLSEASMPTFFECQNGRVALIGVTSSFHDSYLAGPQNQEMQGRPGVAPLRHKAIYELDEDNYNALARIAEATGINNYHDQARKEGYLPTTDNLKFGTFDFAKGKNNEVHTTPLEADEVRTLNVVKDSRLQADVVIVSIHSHQFRGKDKKNVPEFISLFAKKCIDAGADIVACHGPHVMRGIERYGKGVIFHGLGNFILQLETRKMVGEEEYIKAGTSRYTCSGFGGLVKLRSKDGRVGLMADRAAWRSFFAGVTVSDGHMEIELYPIELSKGYNGGTPAISEDISIIEEIRTMSSLMGTTIEINYANKRGYTRI